MAQKRAIVGGAGTFGRACERRLGQQGCEVIVLKKSRGVSGRRATHPTETGAFDHGAQSFTVRGQAFRALVGAT